MNKEEMLAELIARKYLQTPSLVRAFERVDRKDFVPPAFSREAYENYPLPIGFGQALSSPTTVAFMLELLMPQPGERILEIGAGSGWQTALLGYIASEGIKKVSRVPLVVGMERLLALSEIAEANIKKYGFKEKGIAKIVSGDGMKGCKSHAPFDKIISAATGETIPIAWKEQLRVGGRIVAPVGTTIEVHDKLSTGDYNTRIYHGFNFVPLVGDEGGDGDSS